MHILLFTVNWQVLEVRQVVSWDEVDDGDGQDNIVLDVVRLKKVIEKICFSFFYVFSVPAKA